MECEMFLLETAKHFSSLLGFSTSFAYTYYMTKCLLLPNVFRRQKFTKSPPKIPNFELTELGVCKRPLFPSFLPFLAVSSRRIALTPDTTTLTLIHRGKNDLTHHMQLRDEGRTRGRERYAGGFHILRHNPTFSGFHHRCAAAADRRAHAPTLILDFLVPRKSQVMMNVGQALLLILRLFMHSTCRKKSQYSLLLTPQNKILAQLF